MATCADLPIADCTPPFMVGITTDGLPAADLPGAASLGRGKRTIVTYRTSIDE